MPFVNSVRKAIFRRIACFYLVLLIIINVATVINAKKGSVTRCVAQVTGKRGRCRYSVANKKLLFGCFASFGTVLSIIINVARVINVDIGTLEGVCQRAEISENSGCRCNGRFYRQNERSEREDGVIMRRRSAFLFSFMTMPRRATRANSLAAPDGGFEFGELFRRGVPELNFMRQNTPSA